MASVLGEVDDKDILDPHDLEQLYRWKITLLSSIYFRNLQFTWYAINSNKSKPFLHQIRLHSFCSWIDAAPLSRPKKHIGRDFSDGGWFSPISNLIAYVKRKCPFHTYFCDFSFSGRDCTSLLATHGWIAQLRQCKLDCSEANQLEHAQQESLRQTKSEADRQNPGKCDWSQAWCNWASIMGPTQESYGHEPQIFVQIQHVQPTKRKATSFRLFWS